MEIPNKAIYNIARSFIGLVIPESLAFVTDEKRYTVSEFLESESLKAYVEPGDLILIRTPGTFVSSIRKLYGLKYDHLAVFLDKHHVFHISPPKIRIIRSNFLLMTRREPIILRVQMSPKERETFLNNLSNHLADDYDYWRFFRLAAKMSQKLMIGIKEPMIQLNP